MDAEEDTMLDERSGDRALSPHKDGIRYRTFLARAVEAMGANTYFEIGTANGGSLAEIGVYSVAVDPQFKIAPGTNIIGTKPGCLLFQTTSDEFFETYKLSNLFPAPGKLDFAFLDGMHHFEFLLRDFYNTEANAHPGTIVALHDCVPVNPQSTFRQGKDRRRPLDTSTRREVPVRGGWAGDVWKVVEILRAYRPDLDIKFFDAIPTGLVIVQGLDPKNTVLKDKYEEIVARFMDVDLKPGWYDAYMDTITLRPTKGVNDVDKMKAALGL